MLAFRIAGERSSRAAKSGLVTHHDPDSAIALIESFDGGENWLEKSFRIVYKGQEGMGVNDPGISQLIKGDLLLRVAVLDIQATLDRDRITGKIASHRPEHGLVAALRGNEILRSTDQGQTWSEHTPFDENNLRGTCSREPIVELEDGSLLLSVYQGAPQRTDEALLLRSFDMGKSWGDATLIASDPDGLRGQHYGINYNETAVLNLGGGELIAMIRSDGSFQSEEGEHIQVGGIGELMISRTFDSGLSWYPPTPSGVWGQPAHLQRLNDGRILCTYGYRKKPYGIRATLSTDRGHSWSDPIILCEGFPSWDIGYPSSVELTPGKIFTTYYCHKDDQVRHIAGTIWEAP